MTPDRVHSEEWQGNPWKPCPASALEYIGVTPRVVKEPSIHFNDVPPEKKDEVILLGIEPRPPRPAEYKTMTGLLRGLRKHCWWLTDDFSGGGYNCFGYVIGREAVAKGETISAWEPANLPHDDSVDAYDAFLGTYGYTRIPEPARATKVPSSARIAWFSGHHVALRSDYRYEDNDLWESKLGGFRYRILHPLRAVQSKEYGKVKRWYRLT